MRVELGTHVKTRDGEDAGVVKHLIVDPEDNRVKAVVLEQGFILTHDSVASIEELGLSTTDEVQINRLAEELKDLPKFHASDYLDRHAEPSEGSLQDGLPTQGVLWPVVSPFPGSPGGVTGEGAYGMIPLVAPFSDFQESAALGAIQDGPNSEPEAEHSSHLTTVSKGSEVFSASGAKIGEVKDVVFDAMTGRPMSFVISRGVLFKEDVTLPADKIATVDEDGIYLSIEEQEFKKWTTAPSVPFV